MVGLSSLQFCRRLRGYRRGPCKVFPTPFGGERSGPVASQSPYSPPGEGRREGGREGGREGEREEKVKGKEK